MTVLQSQIITNSAVFKANQAFHRESSTLLQERLAQVRQGGGRH